MADNRAVCAALSPEDVALLRENACFFELRVTDNVASGGNAGAGAAAAGFALSRENLFSGRKHLDWQALSNDLGGLPVVAGDPRFPTVSIQQDRPVDATRTRADVAAAYHRLVAAAGEVCYSARLEQGDLFIVNNCAVNHGRSAYRPRFDGEQSRKREGQRQTDRDGDRDGDGDGDRDRDRRRRRRRRRRRK